MKNIYEASAALLPAVAYGDSAGLAFETKDRAFMERHGAVDRLTPIDNPYLGKAAAGEWSDDTQLSLAIADALNEAGGFSMESIAWQHVKALEGTPLQSIHGRLLPRGWGKGTRESVECLQTGKYTFQDSGNAESEGNGVLMKLSPLIVWQVLSRESETHEQIEQLTRMTHNNDSSVVTALTHGDVLSDLLIGVCDASEIAEDAAATALAYEQELTGGRHKLSDLLGKLASGRTPSIDDIVQLAPGGGFHAPETLVMAYGAFMRQPQFPEIVYEAISYGGDKDSIASIAAAIAVLHDEAVTEPHDMDKVASLQRLRRTGRQLIATALGRDAA